MTALPKLTLSPAAPTPGGKVSISFDRKSSGDEYLAFFSGLQVRSSPFFLDWACQC